jgi:hypothetical protein
LICPVVMSVINEMNRNAKGRATVGLVSSTSVIRIIADKPPKIRKLSIIREFSTCRIRSTSIWGILLCERPVMPGRAFLPIHPVQKGCVLKAPD